MSTTSAPEIDELAITQVAVDGMRMHLRGRDRDEAIRRMHGRIDIDIIAWRLYTTPRTVQRVMARIRQPATNYQPLEAAA
ncbi:hypothetical protein QRB38_13165 [Mycobacterium avium subsp. hominissuis]|uniref:hypothetical protein n=1 Tax=Mycobacterium avium TaxID=1764 RepID=UPI0026656BA2|nr:hypothetical protein [Mycobacterium avium]MDO2394760.1 hypothetical protein [Mycobacterium avium subsp. hominissuis]